MTLFEINWGPSLRQLRQFGLLCLVAVPSMGWLWGVNPQVFRLLIVIAAVIAAAGWLRPKLIRPLFIGMMLIAAPIGMVIGELAMILIFFGVFFPISLLFRLMRRDALKLKMDRDLVSHWLPKHEPDDVASYYRRY